MISFGARGCAIDEQPLDSADTGHSRNSTRQLRHMPVETVVEELTRRKVATPRGGRWHGRTVARLLDRLVISGPHWLDGSSRGLFFGAWRFPRRARGEAEKAGRTRETSAVTWPAGF